MQKSPLDLKKPGTNNLITAGAKMCQLNREKSSNKIQRSWSYTKNFVIDLSEINH